MIILNIYVFTIILSLLATLWMCFESKLYAKERGIVRVKVMSRGQKISNSFKLATPCLVPLVNLFYAFSCLYAVFSRRVMEEAMKVNIEKGIFKYKEGG